MLFSRNKRANSEEFEKLYGKLIEIRADLEELRTKYRVLETNISDLRGKFNRKLSQFLKEVEESEEPKPLKSFSPFQ